MRRGGVGIGWRVLIAFGVVVNLRRLLGLQPCDDSQHDGATRTTPGRVAAVLAIFVLSGAAGLIDEIVWSRQLVLVFGNTTQAVSAILTGSSAGSPSGAAVGGRIADRVRVPLRMYGLLECGAGRPSCS